MEVFCTIYYICSYIQTIPQVFKLLKTKSSNDYSLWQVAVGFFGLLCWSLYIYTSKQATIVYVGTSVDLALTIFVDVLILMFYKFDKTKKWILFKKKDNQVGASKDEPNKEVEKVEEK
ncbi:MAG: PQ-loop repeat-containing protein [Clostridia bacterium]|nr:PQ-loop repeat-containing protein [Clostridia bacterium]